MAAKFSRDSQAGKFTAARPKRPQDQAKKAGARRNLAITQVSPPAMREVEKGWWKSNERRVPATEFEMADRDHD